MTSNLVGEVWRRVVHRSKRKVGRGAHILAAAKNHGFPNPWFSNENLHTNRRTFIQAGLPPKKPFSFSFGGSRAVCHRVARDAYPHVWPNQLQEVGLSAPPTPRPHPRKPEFPAARARQCARLPTFSANGHPFGFSHLPRGGRCPHQPAGPMADTTQQELVSPSACGPGGRHHPLSLYC